MSKEEGKPERLDPCDIAEKIFYSPATNGKAEESLEKAVDLILAYAKQELSELKKENEELKLKLSGKTFFDEKEVLESQLSKAKGLLQESLAYVEWNDSEGLKEEIESFLKS